MAAIQRLDKREHLTVGEWVRRSLREVRSRKPGLEPDAKLKAIRAAVKYSFPTDIAQMLSEIELGYKK
jgi:hypothetical protein